MTSAPATLTDQHCGDIRWLTDLEARARGLLVAFCDRNGGVGEAPFDSLNVSVSVGDPRHAAINKERAATAVGFDVASLAQLHQVHGAEVLETAPGRSGIQGKADGLVARAPGVVLGVLSADCVPVLLEGRRGVAALHAGWRGLVAGVLERGVAAVGPVAGAWIGPSIRACCYEVGNEVMDAFRGAGLPVAGARRVDPSDAARAVLTRAGVTNIARSEECTSCSADYFSHRRDGATGRQGSYIALTKPRP
ncbi:MAG: polyphenol oxidase family protein [Actinomycetota bacterium]